MPNYQTKKNKAFIVHGCHVGGHWNMKESYAM